MKEGVVLRRADGWTDNKDVSTLSKTHTYNLRGRPPVDQALLLFLEYGFVKGSIGESSL